MIARVRSATRLAGSAALAPVYRAYAARLRGQVLARPVPQHVALIMDGNRRWARELGLHGVRAGHRHGAAKAIEFYESVFGATLLEKMDGAGGAIVVWYDYRSGGSNNIYAQHVLASGAVDPAWPADGRALCTAANNQHYPQIVSDGTGGAIVTWQDYRSGTNYDVYAQRANSSGLAQWAANGVAVFGLRQPVRDDAQHLRVRAHAEMARLHFDVFRRERAPLDSPSL